VAVLAVLVLGIAGTGLAYVLNHSLLTDEGPTATPLVAYLIHTVAAVLGVLVLGDELPPLTAAGAALVLAGVAIVRRIQPLPAKPRQRLTAAVSKLSYWFKAPPCERRLAAVKRRHRPYFSSRPNKISRHRRCALRLGARAVQGRR
jgi:hypothetical protein